MLYYILIAVGVLALALVLLLVVAALQPTNFRIARSIRVSARPETVFRYVNRLRGWESWSPWAKLDPNMSQTYSGPESGVGAAHGWSGNNQVGEGKMTIAGVEENRRIDMKLEFLRPWKAKNDVSFDFEPDGNGTKVTWAIMGKNDFTGKLFGLLMNMDKMLGKDFDKGLAALKEQVEKA